MFDKFLEDDGKHTFTRFGNMRLVSNSQLCDMIVVAWESVSKEIIIKSFACTGQSKTCVPADISCLKETGVAHDTLKDVEKMWENPLKLDLASQKENEDLDQLYLNECVIDNE